MEDHSDYNKDNRTQTIVNGCLRGILGVWWSETISNERLWQRTIMSDTDGTGDPTEMLGTDWSHFLQVGRQHYDKS